MNNLKENYMNLVHTEGTRACIFIFYFFMENYIFFIIFRSWRINIRIIFFKHMCLQQFFFYSLDKFKNQEYPFEEDS